MNRNLSSASKRGDQQKLQTYINGEGIAADERIPQAGKAGPSEGSGIKRFFGMFEAVFDIGYLAAALLIGFYLLYAGKTVAGWMAVILAGGDAFHLVPRILSITSGNEEGMRRALGVGKQITSITMTVFYLLLWQLVNDPAFGKTGALWNIAVYLLAAARIILCLLPQNRWRDRFPPVSWGIWRNIPFFLLGVLVSLRAFMLRGDLSGLQWVWLAVLLSFLFYLPVVLWSNRNPKLGMLMLPKTCMYLWILIMCLPT